MNQRTTLEVIAPTVEEAIAQGLAELGLTADAVSVEVLDAGNKGLFGLGFLYLATPSKMCFRQRPIPRSGPTMGIAPS